MDSGRLNKYVLFTFLGMSRAKPLVLRQLLDRLPSKVVSKPMIPLRTSLKKSNKRHAIAQAVLGGSGGLGWLWEPLGRSGGALEEIWEALIYKKTSKYSKTISIWVDMG